MPDLNCTEFEARLMDAVEDRRSLADSCGECADWQELRVHANICPHCRRLWNEFALLDRVLPSWKEHVPKVDLPDAVIARWREEQASGSPAPASKPAAPPEDRGSGWSSLFGVVLAVAVAVLASVPFWLGPGGNNEELPGEMFEVSAFPRENASDQTPVPDETEPDVDWQALAQDAGSAYWVLASDTADSFASVAVLVPPRKAAGEIPAPSKSKSPSRWGVAEIGTGLKPIGQDVGRAMGFLFEALPGEQPTL